MLGFPGYLWFAWNWYNIALRVVVIGVLGTVNCLRDCCVLGVGASEGVWRLVG